MLTMRSSQPAFDLKMTMSCDDPHDDDPAVPLPKAAQSKLPKLFMPMPMHRFSIDGGSARFSPSIITRAPLPILNLPSLVPHFDRPGLPAPSESATLRTIPGLPHEGAESDHAPSDSDDDNDDFVDAEDGDDDLIMSSPSSSFDNYVPTTRPPKPTRPIPPPPTDGQEESFLPLVDTSRIDLSFLEPSSASPQTSTFSDKGKGKGPAILSQHRRGSTSASLANGSAISSNLRSSVIVTGRTSVISSHSTTGTDYFSFSSNNSTPWNTARGREIDRERTPRPHDMQFQFPSSPAPSVPIPAGDSGRPGMYKMGSRSMITLLGPTSLVAPSAKGKGKERASEEEAVPESTLADKKEGTGGTIKRERRRSMPTFNPKDEPPPYPDPEFAFTKFKYLQPTEPPEIDILPDYSNSIYVLGTDLPMKVEFEKPGVQSRDRKWKRVTCELEGTAFRLYSTARPSRSGHGPSGSKGSIKSWWERRVGVGDISGETATDAPVATPAGNIKLTDDTGRRLEPDDDGTTELFVVPPSPVISPQLSSSSSLSTTNLSSAESSRSKFSNFLRPSRIKGRDRSHSRSSSDVTASTATSRHASPNPTPRSSFSYSRLSLSPEDGTIGGSSAALSSSSSFNAARPSTSSSRSSFSFSSPALTPENLIRVYTLQHSESGLANDYLKRPNVIRIRMEGTQFLLQLRAVHEVVEWIEALQAANNIALDLDERAMPKGPLFPRRRRRRGAAGTVNRAPRPPASTATT